jgi:hypothetical protein
MRAMILAFRLPTIAAGLVVTGAANSQQIETLHLRYASERCSGRLLDHLQNAGNHCDNCVNKYFGLGLFLHAIVMNYAIPCGIFLFIERS